MEYPQRLADLKSRLDAALDSENFEEAAVLQDQIEALDQSSIQGGDRMAQLQALVDQHLAADELEMAADVMEAMQSAAECEQVSPESPKAQPKARNKIGDMLTALKEESDNLAAACPASLQQEMDQMRAASSIESVKQRLSEGKSASKSSAAGEPLDQQCTTQKVNAAEAALEAAEASGDIFAVIMAKDEVKTQRSQAAKEQAEAEAAARESAVDPVLATAEAARAAAADCGDIVAMLNSRDQIKAAEMPPAAAEALEASDDQVARIAQIMRARRSANAETLLRDAQQQQQPTTPTERPPSSPSNWGEHLKDMQHDAADYSDVQPDGGRSSGTAVLTPEEEPDSEVLHGVLQELLLRASVDFTLSGKTSTVVRLAGCNLTGMLLTGLWPLIEAQVSDKLGIAKLRLQHLNMSCCPPGPQTRKVLKQENQCLDSLGYNHGSLISATCENMVGMSCAVEGLEDLHLQLKAKHVHVLEQAIASQEPSPTTPTTPSALVLKPLPCL